MSGIDDLFPDDEEDEEDQPIPQDAIDEYESALEEFDIENAGKGLVGLNQVTDQKALRGNVFETAREAVDFLKNVTRTISFSVVIYISPGIWRVAIYGSP